MSESDYETNKTAIFKAVVTGISCDELPDMDRDQIERLSGWLASEGIGPTK